MVVYNAIINFFWHFSIVQDAYRCNLKFKEFWDKSYFCKKKLLCGIGLNILPLFLSSKISLINSLSFFLIYFGYKSSEALENGHRVGENIIATTKYEIIMVPSNHSNFQYCDSNIGLFLLPLVKLSLFILFASFFLSVLCFFFDGSLSKVIALPTIAIAIVVALSRS